MNRRDTQKVPDVFRRLPHSRKRLRAKQRTRRYVAAGLLFVVLVASLPVIYGIGRRRAVVMATVEPTAPATEAAPLGSSEVEAAPEATVEAALETSPEAPVAPAESPAAMALSPNPPDEQLPGNKAWKYAYEVYTDGEKVQDFTAEQMCFPEAGEYTALEGVVTFRGGNLRQNAAYGHAALESESFKVMWKNRIGYIDSGSTKWTGTGWTGQPVMVHWPAGLRAVMNIDAAYRQQDDLVEVIYGTLDGNIYFMDARTGNFTRPPINLGFPIKGSVSIDPRGLPLLYVGQGISKINGKSGKIGWRIYSLIDQRELFFLNGHDKLCLRKHGSFDGASLVDGRTDTIIEGGENGIFYRIKLNTEFNTDAASLSINPQVTAYRYKSAVSKELGIENSVAACGGYAWFADNSGLLTCLDLDAMKPVWLLDTGDDTDASIALERAEDGRLVLYTVNQVDKQGNRGRCTIRRVDAMTGISDWSFSVACTSDGDNGGGGFASPAVGTEAYGDYVYFNICRTEKGSTLYCFNKADGEVIWSRSTGSDSWSSPVLVYREDGTGVLVVGNATGRGMLRMYDPASGRKLGGVQLDGLIESSPAVFEDMLVVGTRDCKIYGIRLK